MKYRCFLNKYVEQNWLSPQITLKHECYWHIAFSSTPWIQRQYLYSRTKPRSIVLHRRGDLAPICCASCVLYITVSMKTSWQLLDRNESTGRQRLGSGLVQVQLTKMVLRCIYVTYKMISLQCLV